jgi:geranylgeranyl diphosphate synthase, type II
LHFHPKRDKQIMHSLPDYQLIFQKYLDKNTFTQSPVELYEPVNYILSLGGKRLRPLLVLMGCELFDSRLQKALPAAFAVEVFHNFTLLHDDIMDAAPLRRGKPTVHHKYGINTGILSGDVMLIVAYQYLTHIKPEKKVVKLLRIFNKMAQEVCDGQQLDMNFENRNDVTIPEYIRMIELKTSVLVAAAFQMGALIGGATDAEAEHLYEFGRNVGIAFQIQDDILDTFGDPEKFGKKVGGDIVQNKKTYLVLKSYEIGNAAQKADLEKLMHTPTTNEVEKITAVKNIFQAVNIRAEAEKVMSKYLHSAFTHIDATPLSIEKKNYLKTWAEELMERQV